MTKFLELLEQRSITPEMFQARLELGILADIFEPTAEFGRDNRDQWRKAFGLGKLVPDKIILPIDYTKSLEQMISAGNYDWKNNNITAKCFRIIGEGRVDFEVKLFHFGRSISSGDAVAQIVAADPENPWEPAKAEHLLAFGEKFPDEQRKYPIIGLGSVGEVFGGGRLVLCLCGGSSRRGLDLPWFDVGWDGDYRFLAVRKVTRA